VSADVTAVIPTRDRPSLLADALASVDAQERRPACTVVVDDGSVEPLPPLVGPALQLLRHPRALGVAAARNGGLEQVETEWVAFLDDDDLWAPVKLARQLEAAAQARADFVWCGVVVVDARRSPVGMVAAADPGALLPRLLRTNTIGSPSAVLARTELVRAVGGFDEELALLADWDLWLRLAAAGRGAASPELLVAYTEHAGNMTVAARGGVARELARMAEKHAPLLRRYGGRLGGAELERWNLGGRRRSGGRLGAARDYLVAGVRGRDAGSLLRAPAALLGERLVLRLRARHVAARVGDPAWLEPYRRPETAAAPIAPAA
jgi:glycosyltransferase involved in cell wall biosynthesis